MLKTDLKQNNYKLAYFDMYTTPQPILDYLQMERIKAVYIDLNNY